MAHSGIYVRDSSQLFLLFSFDDSLLTVACSAPTILRVLIKITGHCVIINWNNLQAKEVHATTIRYQKPRRKPSLWLRMCRVCACNVCVSFRCQMPLARPWKILRIFVYLELSHICASKPFNFITLSSFVSRYIRIVNTEQWTPLGLYVWLPVA